MYHVKELRSDGLDKMCGGQTRGELIATMINVGVSQCDQEKVQDTLAKKVTRNWHNDNVK
jgi:hypothetical protein